MWAMLMVAAAPLCCGAASGVQVLAEWEPLQTGSKLGGTEPATGTGAAVPTEGCCVY